MYIKEKASCENEAVERTSAAEAARMKEQRKSGGRVSRLVSPRSVAGHSDHRSKLKIQKNEWGFVTELDQSSQTFRSNSPIKELVSLMLFPSRVSMQPRCGSGPPTGDSPLSQPLVGVCGNAHTGIVTKWLLWPLAPSHMR